MIAFPNFDPSDWYWRASDGRIYSSARGQFVNPYDAGYMAFVAKRGGVTPWPTDDNGQQTVDSLRSVLSQYGIATN